MTEAQSSSEFDDSELLDCLEDSDEPQQDPLPITE